MSIKEKRRGVNTIALVFFILAAGFYLINEKYPLAGKQPDPYVSVTAVHDGDTVSVQLDKQQEKIRLIGIDAPEIGQKPWGENSMKYLENILNTSERKVRLEYDVEKRDTYGRLLAYLWTTKGEMVNVLMLRGGYAMLYTFPPNVKYAGEFREAQKEAREKRLGIWSEKGLEEKPGDYRKEHPRI